MSVTSRSPRVVKTTKSSLDELSLTPEDFFVLSRLDTAATVGEISVATGLPVAQVDDVVKRLVRQGVVEIEGASVSEAGTIHRNVGLLATKNSKLPKLKLSGQPKKSSRRIDMLRAALKVTNAEVLDDVAVRPEVPCVSVSTQSGVETRVMGTPLDGGARVVTRPRKRSITRTLAADVPVASVTNVKPVAEKPLPKKEMVYPTVCASDSRVNNALDISVEEQRSILGISDGVALMSCFQLLNIEPTREQTDVHRAYHTASRRFHPDRYFGRKVGDFDTRLNEVFEAVSRAYAELLPHGRKGPVNLARAPATTESTVRGKLSGGQRRAIKAKSEQQAKSNAEKATHQFEQGQSEFAAGRFGAKLPWG